MELSLYSAATGMAAQQLNLDVISNNLANVNTTGFKRSKNEFQDLMYQNIRPAGGDSGSGIETPVGIQAGNGSRLIASNKVFTQGSLTQTDLDWDIAIDGDGFLEVELPDGTSAYTRDGALKVDNQGQVTSSSGYRLKNGFPVIPQGATISFSDNGQVSIQAPEGRTNFQLQLVRFINPSGLENMGGNLLLETEASGAPDLGNPRERGFGGIKQGYLEMSNVNVVQEMVNMIVAQRAYEINSKSIQTSDEMLSNLKNLKR